MAEYCNDRFELVEDNEDSFGMWQGLVGPHYTPIMSNDGTLSWTNNGFLPNPDSVNLRGPQGAGLTIAGIRESTAGLPESAAAGVVWLVGTEEPYEGYSYINDEWIDLGPMTVGPAGPPGPQGDDYTLTSADKTEIAGEAEQLLLNDLNNNPLPVTKGGTGAQTLAGAQENLGITDLADQIGDTPLATAAQDIRGAINELVGDLGSLDFDTSAQDVTGAVNELQAGKVSKTGDTMTGDLLIDDADMSLSTNDAEIATSRTGTVTKPIINIKDKNGAVVGWLRGLFRPDGRSGIQFGAQRGQIPNAIALEVDNNNDAVVTLGAPLAWRTALGLAIATSTSTASNIASNGSNTTISAASYAEFGKIAMLHLEMSRSVNSGTDTNINIATLVSGKRPIIPCGAVIRYTGANVKAYIDTDGKVYMNTPASIPSGTTLVLEATYILA